MRIPKFLIKLASKIYITKNIPFFMYNPEFHKLKGFEIRQILNLMRPYDILLRRHNGYLNGLAIPGYWMHVALVLPDGRIANSTKYGVISEDILDWFRCDCCSLLRPNISVDLNYVAKKATSMLDNNTKYDYEFSADNGKVYCTEFIDICYENIFKHSYKNINGSNILLPDGLYNSKLLDELITFKH